MVLAEALQIEKANPYPEYMSVPMRTKLCPLLYGSGPMMVVWSPQGMVPNQGSLLFSVVGR